MYFIGTSLYDKNATCTVVINQTIIIFCDDALQGILITILSYFVFGICYPQNLEKTLEFIQRYLELFIMSCAYFIMWFRLHINFNTNFFQNVFEYKSAKWRQTLFKKQTEGEIIWYWCIYFGKSRTDSSSRKRSF